jgi:hypothetical protein
MAEGCTLFHLVASVVPRFMTQSMQQMCLYLNFPYSKTQCVLFLEYYPQTNSYHLTEFLLFNDFPMKKHGFHYSNCNIPSLALPPIQRAFPIYVSTERHTHHNYNHRRHDYYHELYNYIPFYELECNSPFRFRIGS